MIKLYILGDLHMYVALLKPSGREEGKADMFAIVSTYRARVGEEDAIIALHEDWERRNQGLKSYLSWQLFRNIQAPRDFIAFAQFENEELARAATNDLKKDAWYDRLISLTEGETVHIDYMNIWQLQ
ncbi:MAG: hypothetical protein M3Y39_20125 [Chloroflexota bacterium]|nr:hypothetical protein [Chloroflexota bacterium]